MNESETKVSEKEIREAFNRINGMKIMIIGDVMIDSYMWGKVERISPEAPIPIVSVKKRENRLGGAANVALNIRALGAKPIMCSVTGNDEKRDLYLQLMHENRMDDTGILVRDDRVTTIKTRVIGSSQQLLRVDEENSKTIDENTEIQFIDLIKKIISSGGIDAVIFEDYDKGVITPGIIKSVIEFARIRDIPVSADPKKRNFSHYKNIDLFTPNLKEMSEGLLMEIPGANMEMIALGAQRLEELNEIRCLLLTLSEMGIYLRHEGKGKLIAAEKRDIADVSGAGDTVISVATACMAAGMETETMTIIANLAGGLVCEKVGVVPVDKQQLLHETLKLFNKRP